MIYHADIEGRNYKIDITQNADTVKVSVNGQPQELHSLRIDRNQVASFHLGGKYYQIEIVKNGDGYLCWLGSKLLRLNIIDEKTARFSRLANNQSAAHKSEMLLAPMPGLIIKVEVEPGQAVKKGQGLVIMEAMKMENELRAAHDCVIGEIRIRAGQIVDKAQPLIIFR